MIQKIRRRVLVAGALAASGLFGAEANSAARTGNLSIALVLKSIKDPYAVAMADAARNYQKHYPYPFDLVIRGTATEIDAARQQQIVNDLIDAQMSAIVLAPVDSKSLVPAATRAVRAGIITIAIDNPLDTTAFDAAGLSIPFVGPDNRRGAKMVGDYLAKKLRPGDQVGIIEGVSSDRNSQQRIEGYTDAMNAASMKIVAVDAGDWDYGKGKIAASRMLAQYPLMRALMCANDNMALGAVDAVRDARRAGRLYITGYNNFKEIQPLLDDGSILATVDQFPARQAVFGLDVALSALVGQRKQQDLSSFIETPLQLVVSKAANRE